MSLNIDPSLWTLQTAGGIKYKLFEDGPTGEFGNEGSGGVSLEETYIIQAIDLMPFVSESFSSYTAWPDGVYTYTGGRSCPGFNGALTKTVSFKPFPPGKPWNPSDPTADTETYTQFLLLTIRYDADVGDPNSDGGDQDDPETFLEVNVDLGVEFLMMRASAGMYFKASKQHTNQAGEQIDANKYESPYTANIPAAKVQPQAEWNVRWPKFPWTGITYLMTKVRPAIGKINSTTMSLFYNAPAETILFLGMTIRKEFQVISEKITAVAQVEMKFAEKRVETYTGSDVIKGHNHFFRPDTGTYDELWFGHMAADPITGVLGVVPDNRVYETTDLNLLWR